MEQLVLCLIPMLHYLCMWIFFFWNLKRTLVIINNLAVDRSDSFVGLYSNLMQAELAISIS